MYCDGCAVMVVLCCLVNVVVGERFEPGGMEHWTMAQTRAENRHATLGYIVVYYGW